MPNRQHTIIWSNDGLVCWRKYASLGLNELWLRQNGCYFGDIFNVIFLHENGSILINKLFMDKKNYNLPLSIHPNSHQPVYPANEYKTLSKWFFKAVLHRQQNDACKLGQYQAIWCPQPENINSLMQDCSISSALALEILQSCTKPSIYLSINP